MRGGKVKVSQETALGHTRSDRERLGCDGVELDERSTP